MRRLIFLFLLLSARAAIGQVQISGTVYDESQRFAMIGVSVMGTSGIGTTTDSLGHYTIRLPQTDSIYFSYLGKFTAKYPVKDVPSGQEFDMALQVSVDSLPAVYVHGRDYLTDSISNRKEYAKVFDYQAKYLDGMKAKRGGLGVGLDMDMFFNGKQRRQMEHFQARLVQEEQDNYVDHKFTRAIVKKITGLDTPALDTFMKQYRPSYEFIQSCATEYEFYHYIQEWGKFFKDDWKESHQHAAASSAAKKPEDE